jgi:ubiquinone biosynthesis protein UbiJ
MPVSLAAKAFNHVLHQNAWATERLRAFAGRRVKLSLLPFEASFIIAESGDFLPAPEGAAAEAAIILTPTAALRLLADRPPEQLVKVEGDSDLATEIGKVLRQLQWEYEEDLSRIVGDIPAHQLVSMGKRAAAESKRQATSLAGMLAEYWLEEQPLIAKRRHLEQFSKDVDALRDDVERLAKRLEKLERIA